MDKCSRCGKAFECGRTQGLARCWCEELPPVDIKEGESCLCPDCLRAAPKR